MTYSATRRTFLAGSTATAALAALPVAADGHATVVEMLNVHPDDRKLRNVFFPRVISVNAGDTATFKATDRGHNSASIKDMVPEGAEEWKGKLNKDIEVTFDVPGFYGYACTPHAAAGMVAMVVVEGEGKLDNLEAAQGIRHRGRARAVFEDLWAEAAKMGLLEPTA